MEWMFLDKHMVVTLKHIIWFFTIYRTAIDSISRDKQLLLSQEHTNWLWACADKPWLASLFLGAHPLILTPFNHMSFNVPLMTSRQSRFFLPGSVCAWIPACLLASNAAPTVCLLHCHKCAVHSRVMFSPLSLVICGNASPKINNQDPYLAIRRSTSSLPLLPCMVPRSAQQLGFFFSQMSWASNRNNVPWKNDLRCNCPWD